MKNLLKYISILLIVLGVGLGFLSTPTFAVDQNFWTKTASHVLMTNDGTGLANADIHVRNCYIGTGTGTPCGGGGGGGGTVTSVGLALPTAVFNISGSPVTTSGTLTATFDTQNANLIFAGPATGAAATPTFRALTADDFPSSLISPYTVVNTSSIFSTGLTGTGTGSVATDAFFSGVNAGNGATNAIHSIFIGNGAGQNATGANNLICLGQECGQNASGAGHGVFLGTAAGNGATNAAFSNFFGNSAGLGATDASNSNFIGTGAGSAATNALNSNFLGAGAGGSATNAENSIFIGTNAGQSDTVDNTVSGSSILIGSNTSTAGFQNSIAIGEGATNTAINEFLIDSAYTQYNFRGLPYTMPSVQATTDQVLTATSVGGGIATLGWATVPTLDLETDGTPNGDQTLLNLIGGAGIILTDDGIGGVTIDSDLTFQVNGSPTPTQTLLNLVAGTGITITDSGAGDVTFDVTGGGGTTIYTGDGTISGSRTVDMAGNDLNFSDSASGDKAGLYIDTAGLRSALGSAHTSGNTSLFVDNNTNTVVVEAGSLQIPAGATAGYVLTSDATGIASWQAAGAGSGTVTDFIFTDGSGFDGTVSTSTSTPTLALTTSLTTGSVPFIGASGALNQDNAQFFFDNTNDHLGLGTATPTAKLDLREARTGLTAAWTGYSGTNSGSTFNTTAGVLTNTVASFVNTATRSAGANALTNIGLVASASGAQNNYAALFPLGNVGITQSSPTAKLHITTDAIGVTQTDASGILLQNTTAAALGAQQYSPGIVLEGRGWATTGGTSQSSIIRIQNQPQQNAAGVFSRFYVDRNNNAGGYSELFSIGEVGGSSSRTLSINGATVFGIGGGTVQFYGSSSGMGFYDSTGGSLYATQNLGRWALTPASLTTAATINTWNLAQTWNNASGVYTGHRIAITNTSSASTSRIVDYLVGGTSVFSIDTAGSTIFGGTARLKGYTVATLPTGTVGDTAYVTDALAPTFLTTVVGGGSVVTPVFFNGSTWVAQ